MVPPHTWHRIWPISTQKHSSRSKQWSRSPMGTKPQWSATETLLLLSATTISKLDAIRRLHHSNIDSAAYIHRLVSRIRSWNYIRKTSCHIQITFAKQIVTFKLCKVHPDTNQLSYTSIKLPRIFETASNGILHWTNEQAYLDEGEGCPGGTCGQ